MDWQCVSLHYSRMKPIIAKYLALTSLAVALEACVPPPAPPPAVAPAPAPTPTPTATPSPLAAEPAYHSYLDAPQTPGDWRYDRTALGGAASFGADANAPVFVLACDRTRGEVQLRRPGTATTPLTMRIVTETTVRLLDAVPGPSGSPWLTTSLNARDSLLDAMAVTKGRFAIETESMPTLYIPSWAEVTRVIEDCR